MRVVSLCLSFAALAVVGCGNPVDTIDKQRAASACGEAGVAAATRDAEGRMGVTCNGGDTVAVKVEGENAEYLAIPLISDEAFDLREYSSIRLTGREKPEVAISRILSGFEQPTGEGAALYAQKGYKLSEVEPLRIVVERTGFMDDSVSGERHVIEYVLDEKGERTASAYGVQLQCVRGEMAGKWGKGPCS